MGGGDRLEARARGRLPPPPEPPPAPQRPRRDGGADRERLLHDPPRLHAPDAQPHQEGPGPHGRHPALRPLRGRGGLRLLAPLQVLRRQELEALHRRHGHRLPRPRRVHDHGPQRLPHPRRGRHRRLLRHHPPRLPRLGLRLHPPRLRGLLLWLPRRQDRGPHQDQPDRALHPRGPLLRRAPRLHPHRRPPPLRERLHRALLHHERPLAPPALLHHGLPYGRPPHPRGHLRAGLHGHVLPAALRRGPPLVVEELRQLRLGRLLPLPLLPLVPDVQAGSCWWKSFANCASAGFYLFLYSLWFLTSKLDLVGVLPVVVYLTYMSMISIAFGLMCGTIGYLSCFWFTRSIYGAVKVD